MKTTIPISTRQIDDKKMELSPKRNTKVNIEPLRLNIGNDHQQSYRTSDAQRDEAVNTVSSTFRR